MPRKRRSLRESPARYGSPVVYVIAGPNGSGKTTFAREFLKNEVHCPEFVNADLIAGGLSPLAPERAALAAGRVMSKRMRELAARRRDFAFETTLSGRTHAIFLRRLKSAGYKVHMRFLWVHSVDLALRRVADRVALGGHNVPEKDVRRRFKSGLLNLFRVYRSLADSLVLVDNSYLESPRLVASEMGGQLTVFDPETYARIKI